MPVCMGVEDTERYEDGDAKKKVGLLMMEEAAAIWAAWSALSASSFLASSDKEAIISLSEEEPIIAGTIDRLAIGYSLIVKEVQLPKVCPQSSSRTDGNASLPAVEDAVLVYKIPETRKFVAHTKSEEKLLSLYASQQETQQPSSVYYEDDSKSNTVARKKLERPFSAVGWRIADESRDRQGEDAKNETGPSDAEKSSDFFRAEKSSNASGPPALLLPSEISDGVVMRTSEGREVRSLAMWRKDTGRNVNPPSIPVPSRRTPRSSKRCVVEQKEEDNAMVVVVSAAKDVRADFGIASCHWDLDGRKRNSRDHLHYPDEDKWRVVMYGNAELPVPLELPLLPASATRQFYSGTNTH